MKYLECTINGQNVPSVRPVNMICFRVGLEITGLRIFGRIAIKARNTLSVLVVELLSCFKIAKEMVLKGN